MCSRRFFSAARPGGARPDSGIAKPDARTKLFRMSFAQLLDNLPLQKSRLLHRFEDLISPKTDAELEALAQESRALTLRNFGRTMRLFAPLYLSNECITIAVTAASRGTTPSCALLSISSK